MDIQWYPGHMTKSVRMMEEQIALVDIVIELLDARVPRSSKNPDIDRVSRNKKRILALNKSDLADKRVTDLWVEYYSKNNYSVLMIDSQSGDGFKKLAVMCMVLMSEKIEREQKRGRVFVPVRAMVAGIPNVGKSTFINRFVGKSPAKTADKPGVTRGRQWIRMKHGFELLDTPGILWPKLDDPETGVNLALTGAISGIITDSVELCLLLIKALNVSYPNALRERYGVEIAGGAPEVLEKIAKLRGYGKKAGEPDVERAASAIINEFRAGKLGRVSLERP